MKRKSVNNDDNKSQAKKKQKSKVKMIYKISYGDNVNSCHVSRIYNTCKTIICYTETHCLDLIAQALKPAKVLFDLCEIISEYYKEYTPFAFIRIPPTNTPGASIYVFRPKTDMKGEPILGHDLNFDFGKEAVNRPLIKLDSLVDGHREDSHPATVPMCIQWQALFLGEIVLPEFPQPCTKEQDHFWTPLHHFPLPSNVMDIKPLRCHGLFNLQITTAVHRRICQRIKEQHIPHDYRSYFRCVQENYTRGGVVTLATWMLLNVMFYRNVPERLYRRIRPLCQMSDDEITACGVSFIEPYKPVICAPDSEAVFATFIERAPWDYLPSKTLLIPFSC